MIKLHDGMTYEGNLTFKNDPISKLPNNLTVKGNLHIEKTKITELPENLTVYGHLYLWYSDVTKLPDSINVYGGLFLQDSKITEISSALKIEGSLVLTGNPVSKLPDNLIVPGNLELSYTPLTELPSGLIVGETLDLSYSNITKLPDGLIVGRDLELDYSKIASLPEDLVVGGELDLRNTKIKLPANITVGGDVSYYRSQYKNDLKGVNIMYIENGEYVDGKYVFLDGVIIHVSHREIICDGKYAYYVGRIPGLNVITDGNFVVQCNSVDDGIKELNFKHAESLGINQYAELTLGSTVSIEDVVTLYRIISEVDQIESREFDNDIRAHSIEHNKETYAIWELIEIMKDHDHIGYSEFVEFFT